MICMDERARYAPAWNEVRVMMRGPLSDKKISRYAKEGFYSAEYRQARRERMAQKANKRRGNFVEVEGRMVFSPV